MIDAEERQRTMDFLLSQQAKFDAHLNELRENDAKADVRLTRLENILRGAIRAGLRERRQWREKYAALVNAQIRTEDSVRELKDSMGELREVTRRNNQGIEALREVTQRNSEAIQRNSEDIGRLARIVERTTAGRNGDEPERESETGE